MLANMLTRVNARVFGFEMPNVEVTGAPLFARPVDCWVGGER